MASGVIHTTATLCASSVAVAHYGLDNIPASSAWLLAGLYCCIVQPDIDTMDSSGYYGLYVLERTKDGLQHLWRMYWYPYSRLLKHRSFFSHAPVIGTLIRLMYGGFWMIPFLLMWQGGDDFITAIIAMDALHALLDMKLWGWIRLFRQGKDKEDGRVARKK